jgi:hypothetical protein
MIEGAAIECAAREGLEGFIVERWPKRGMRKRLSEFVLAEEVRAAVVECRKVVHQHKLAR